ncbi:MAG: nucleoside triphosphate pyrophosphohydrolase [Candidatus Gracilibacteria bacterium]|nr:nucleoside triphosphate pyrophosphohydrolase [Candidatus Gracilibacteria bacterium]
MVRDNIPKIIENNGVKPDYYIADNNEYKDELFKKLLEEAKEVIEEKNNSKNLKEELGDLLEVFESILKLENIDISEIIKI